MRPTLRLAWRHLASRPRQSALAVAGVAVGVTVFVFTLAMMDGLMVFFTQRLIRVSPLLTVMPERLDVERARESLREFPGDAVRALSRVPPPDDRPTVRGAAALAQRLQGVAEVAGVSVAASAPAVVSYGTIAEPATLVGIDPAAEATVTDLPAAVVHGNWMRLGVRRDGAVVGSQLADRLGVQVGDRLVAVGDSGANLALEVVGIIATGLGATDEATAFVNLSVAQAAAGWGADEGTEIRVRTRRLDRLEGVRRLLEGVTGHRVESWEESNQSALKLFRMIALTTYLLTGFVLVVAGLGIANKLTTIILDKERDIALLRSLGFSRWALRGVFVLEGVLLGAAGALAGCALAATSIAVFTAFPIRFAARQGAVMAYTQLFLANDPRYYVVISGAALVISAIAAMLAVRRAVRVVPVEVLRGVG